ncbi:hypothetical protein BH10PSE6_BH10PSE6_09540 [soil metagenome]
MKTTVDLPDELYRRAKAEAALRGKKLRELVAEGLARVLEAPAEQRPKAKISPVMKRARGVMDSGVSDLASNPKHLSGFGRNARHR